MSRGHQQAATADDDDALSRRRSEIRFEVGVHGDLCVIEPDGSSAEHSTGGVSPTLVHDVSRTGLKLSTHSPLLPGEKAMVRFALPGGQTRTRTVRIKWVKRVGSGFEAGAEATGLYEEPPAKASSNAGQETMEGEVYYEAEGQFVDEADEAFDPTQTIETPLPNAGRVAAAYTDEPEPSGPAALPVHVPRPQVDRGAPASKIVETRLVAVPMPRGALEYLALGLVAMSMGAIIWLVLSGT